MDNRNIYFRNASEPGDAQNTLNKPLDGSTSVLILGILSLMLCWFYGVISIVLGIIALVISGSTQREYEKHRHIYTEASYRNLRTGRFCAILGLCFGILSMLIVLMWALLFGTLIFNFFF